MTDYCLNDKVRDVFNTWSFEVQRFSIRTISIISVLFSLSFPAYADGFFSKLFEPSFIKEHKEACINSIRNELRFEPGFKSGFPSYDVFDASFLPSSKNDGDLSYFFNLRIEGTWLLAMEIDASSTRLNINKRIVDEFRNIDLGTLRAEDVPFVIPEMYDRQHIDFRGLANCTFFSKDSKRPHTTYIRSKSS